PAILHPGEGGQMARFGGVLLAPWPRECKCALGTKESGPVEGRQAPDLLLFEKSGSARLPTMRIALYEPDIPQNTGTILRLAACLGVEAHIVEPTGFPSSDRAFRRAGMDYLDQVSLRRHASWTAFDSWRRSERLRLLLFT